MTETFFTFSKRLHTKFVYKLLQNIELCKKTILIVFSFSPNICLCFVVQESSRFVNFCTVLDCYNAKTMQKVTNLDDPCTLKHKQISGKKTNCQNCFWCTIQENQYLYPILLPLKNLARFLSFQNSESFIAEQTKAQ